MCNGPVCHAGVELASVKVCSAASAPADAYESAHTALIPARHGCEAPAGCDHEAPAAADSSRSSLGHGETRGRQLVSSAFSELGSQAAAAGLGAPRSPALSRSLHQRDSASCLHGGAAYRCSAALDAETGTEPPRGDGAGVSACAETEGSAGQSGSLHPAKRAREAAAPDADACESEEAAALLASGSGHPPSSAAEVVWYRRSQVLLTLAGYGCALIMRSACPPARLLRMLALRYEADVQAGACRMLAMLFNLLDEVRIFAALQG